MTVYRDDPNLQALWLLEETSGDRADESVNENTLTDNNTVGSSTDSQEGDRSADFEQGNNEYLSITDGAQTGLDITGSITICCWIKPEALDDGTGHALVSKYVTSGNQRSYILWLLEDSGNYYPRLNVSSDGSSVASATADTAVSAGAWVHIAAVYDGTDIRIYRNGSLDITPVSYSSGIYNSTADLRLGRHSESVWEYDGLMDEVAVFDRALSAAEVEAIYNEGIPLPQVYSDDANLEALWLMEETSGDRADESVNENTLTDNNTVGSSTDSQEGDRSADFEQGNNEYLSITDGAQTGLDITGSITICCWIKPEALDDGTGHTLGGKHEETNDERSYLLWLKESSGSYYAELDLSDDGNNLTAASSDTAVGTGTWVHIAAVYDGTDIRIYRNGSLDITPVSYSSGIHDGTAPFQLGQAISDSVYYNLGYYDGLMDEVAVFSRALDKFEVQSIYENGIQLVQGGERGILRGVARGVGRGI